MGALPGIDHLYGGDLTESQTVIAVVVTYILIGFFLGLLILAVCNFYQILIKQGKYRVVPLLAFYILTVLTIVTRLLTLIFFFYSNYGIFLIVVVMMQPIFKVNVGLVQVWIMAELTIRLSQSLVKDNQMSTEEALSASVRAEIYAKEERLEGWIRACRYFVLTMVHLECAIFLIVVLYASVKYDADDELETRDRILGSVTETAGWLFLVNGVLLCLVSFCLLRKIKEKNQLLNQDREVFRRESATIAVIMLSFGTSYLIRWLWDSFLKTEVYDKNYFEYILLSELVIMLCSDGLTLLGLLLFHFYNFKEAPLAKQVQDLQEIPGFEVQSQSLICADRDPLVRLNDEAESFEHNHSDCFDMDQYQQKTEERKQSSKNEGSVQGAKPSSSKTVPLKLGSQGTQPSPNALSSANQSHGKILEAQSVKYPKNHNGGISSFRQDTAMQPSLSNHQRSFTGDQQTLRSSIYDYGILPRRPSELVSSTHESQESLDHHNSVKTLRFMRQISQQSITDASLRKSTKSNNQQNQSHLHMTTTESILEVQEPCLETDGNQQEDDEDDEN